MNQIIIRRANVDDANSILDINIDSWKKTYKGIFSTKFLENLCKEEDEYFKSLNKIISKIKEKNNYLVAVCNDKVVGFTNFGKSKKDKYFDCGEIYSIYIQNNFIKQGIGKKILNETIKILKKDYERVIVSCLKDNSSNIFYEKMNFEKIDECEFILDNNVYLENLYEFK